MEAHIARPMHTIFNGPMTTHQRKQMRGRASGRRPARHHGDLLATPQVARAPSPPAAYPSDLLDRLPAPLGRQIRAEIIGSNHPQFPDLEPPARLFHRLDIGCASGRQFRAQLVPLAFPSRGRNLGLGDWQPRCRFRRGGKEPLPRPTHPAPLIPQGCCLSPSRYTRPPGE